MAQPGETVKSVEILRPLPAQRAKEGGLASGDDSERHEIEPPGGSTSAATGNISDRLRAALEAAAFQALARQLRAAEGVLYRPDDNAGHDPGATPYIRTEPTLKQLYKELQARKRGDSQQSKRTDADNDGTKADR